MYKPFTLLHTVYMTFYINQSSERRQKRKFKALKNSFKIVKSIVIFFVWFTTDGTDSKWTKYCNIKAFYKTRGVYSYNQRNYFQRGCIDKRRSGDFSALGTNYYISTFTLLHWSKLYQVVHRHFIYCFIISYFDSLFFYCNN